MTVHENGNGLVESRWQLANAEVDDDQLCIKHTNVHKVFLRRDFFDSMLYTTSIQSHLTRREFLMD